SAMSGNGPQTGGPQSTRPMRRSRAAFRKIRAAVRWKKATTPVCRRPRFPARSSKVARICARRITAAATGRRRAMRKAWARLQAIWDSDASFEGEVEGPSSLQQEDFGHEGLTKVLARSDGRRRRHFDGERPGIRATATEAQHPLHHGRRYRMDAAAYLPPR